MVLSLNRTISSWPKVWVLCSSLGAKSEASSDGIQLRAQMRPTSAQLYKLWAWVYTDLGQGQTIQQWIGISNGGEGEKNSSSSFQQVPRKKEKPPIRKAPSAKVKSWVKEQVLPKERGLRMMLE